MKSEMFNAEMFVMRGLLAVCAAALLIGLGAMLLIPVPVAPTHMVQSRVAHTASAPNAKPSCAHMAATADCK